MYNTEQDRLRIEQVLISFRIGYSDMRVTVGKTMTLYEFKPVIGTRMNKIRNLKDEFTVALEAQSVRVIAPIPGRGTVGIEVPHKKKEILHLGEILGSDEFLTTDMTLPLALGKTITGKTFIADLADMPHLLVAGATGQGKSVGLNVMLMSLLHKRTPEELRLVLIDPKKVELKPYETLGKAYLATPIITESAAADRALSALCGIMDARYEKVGEKGRRNIAEYNASPDVEKMPYYVVVIDEYADLMMTSGKEAEMAICRLAQKARAVGIHLIISTQRPSATIVTGNIKANFPTRIAFRTTTGTDSRVILDQVGAEKLTGNGDMLYFAGAELTRVQCAYVGIDEVEATCREIGESYADFGGYEAEDIDRFVFPKPLPWAATKIGHDALALCQCRFNIEKKHFCDENGVLQEWLVKAMQEVGIIGKEKSVCYLLGMEKYPEYCTPAYEVLISEPARIWAIANGLE